MALGVADRLLMLSNAVFSVASPEACASILWKDLDRVEEMANALKITAFDLVDLGIADEIIREPIGGAHLDFTTTSEGIRKSLQTNLAFLISQNPITLVEQRYDKLRKIAQLNE